MNDSLHLKVVKVGWHLLIAAAAATEFAATTKKEHPFRRLLLGGVVGFHLAAALIDLEDDEQD